MLFQRSRHRKAAAKAAPVFALEAPDMDDQRGARLCALAQRARDELLPWLSTPCVPARPGLGVGVCGGLTPALSCRYTHMFTPVFTALGQHEGVGVRLHLARWDIHGSGSMSLEQEQAWFRESEEIIEHILSFLSNVMVVTTLCLAITIPLAVYVTETEISDNSSLESEEWWGGWEKERVQRALHWAECSMLAVSIALASIALLNSFASGQAFSFYLPDTEAKMRFALPRAMVLSIIWQQCVFSVLFLLFALPFSASRVSPISAVTTSVAVVVTFIFALWSMFAHGGDCAAMQHEEGRRLLAKAARGPPRGEGGGGGGGEAPAAGGFSAEDVLGALGQGQGDAPA